MRCENLYNLVSQVNACRIVSRTWSPIVQGVFVQQYPFAVSFFNEHLIFITLLVCGYLFAILGVVFVLRHPSDGYLMIQKHVWQWGNCQPSLGPNGIFKHR